uniref:Pre-mRNA-splicing factor 18 n=1 Tax=Trypanosoma congolense (strain IL3000) TaxID=1068625 RepID=G0UPU1_TRYCI|nr:conserved hypothetical protein [Trypanosoma congolense IL3000]
MSFEGLLGRLKKKVSSSSGDESTATDSLTEGPKSVYDAAMREASTCYPERKRGRSPPIDADVSVPGPAEDAGKITVPIAEEVPVVSGVARVMCITEEEFHSQYVVSENALAKCVETMSNVIKSPVSADINILNNAEITGVSVTSLGFRACALPSPLCRFLVQRLQCLSPASAISDATYQEEYNLLCELKNATDDDREMCANVPPPLQEHVAILRTFWFALCLYWRAALCGTILNTSSYEGGWSYDIYLLQQRSLPESRRRERGRQVSLGLEAWQRASRVRQDVFDFLAVVLHDVLVLMRELLENSVTKEDGDDQCVIPANMVKSFFLMQKLLRARDFAGCRQHYVDLTMGTANWKLGLFSGGEVHMRRSMERIERRRIVHILHNENALRLLHALREIMDFVQHHEAALESFGFFA